MNFFKNIFSYVYRLDGPGKWEGAREAIMTIDERILVFFIVFFNHLLKAGMRGIELPCKRMGNANGIVKVKAGKKCSSDGAPKASIVNHQQIAHDGMPPLFAFFLIALALTFWAMFF